MISFPHNSKSFTSTDSELFRRDCSGESVRVIEHFVGVSSGNLINDTPHHLEGDNYNQLTSVNRDSIVRPCHYLSRMLGVWQPGDAHILWKIYNYFSYVLFAGSIAYIIAICKIHSGEFKLYELLNSIGTILDFCFPFLFLKYYYRSGNYENLMVNIHATTEMSERKTIYIYQYVYTFISFLIWVSMVVFFTFHWLPFSKDERYIVGVIVTLVYTLGWWANWLTLYCFVCHIHKFHFSKYEKYIDKMFKRVIPETRDDKILLRRLLSEFNVLQTLLTATQSNFSIIISFAVAYHIYDIIVFSLAFWNGTFGPPEKYGIQNYYGTIIFDTLSILIKLYPAAIMHKSIQNIVKMCANHCNTTTNVIPYQRIAFYEHLYHRKQIMGFHILGINITTRKTITIFVFVTTATCAFIRLLVPKSLFS